MFLNLLDSFIVDVLKLFIKRGSNVLVSIKEVKLLRQARYLDRSINSILAGILENRIIPFDFVRAF